jgi:hypothetical protein
MCSVPRFSFGGVPWESIYADTNSFAVGVGIVDRTAGNVGMPNFDSRVDNGHFEAIGITTR